MDFLTHLCLPVAVCYSVFPDWFPSYRYLMIGALGLIADFDKFLGIPGLLHSLLTLIPICAVILIMERFVRMSTHSSDIPTRKISLLAILIILSHIVLDIVDGGPVPLLYPLVKSGIGLEYPIQTVFGEGIFGITFRGSLVDLRVLEPRQGHNTYGFINGYGIISFLVLLIIVTSEKMDSC